ncbi:RDD family protein [Nocardia sp. NPDC059177]|uniref:RDD family protein n=1 Tax=Nocardia sp. NPDC059177 TaxID=3346759 RepID=UPI0036C439CD
MRRQHNSIRGVACESATAPCRQPVRVQRAADREHGNGGQWIHLEAGERKADHGRPTRLPGRNDPPEPQLFGGLDDTRFPSPRKLPRTLAFVLDVVTHVVIGLGMYFVVSPDTQFAVMHQEWDELRINWLAVIGCALLASFIDRVLFQAITHTTFGKAVFGLVILDRDTGRYPRLRWLLASWVVSTLLAIELPFMLIAFDGAGPSRPERYLLPAVRRRDVEMAPAPKTDLDKHTASSETTPSTSRIGDAVSDGIIGSTDTRGT